MDDDDDGRTPPPAKVDEALDALQQLEARQPSQLSIFRLSEPITSEIDTHKRRVAAASPSVDDGLPPPPTPASLEADLAHYRELFSKLRFSYVEQVTKEKFLRAIVGDPPLIVTPLENIQLEKENLAAKAHLKQRKNQVQETVDLLERRAAELVRADERIRHEKQQLVTLPTEIRTKEERISELRKKHDLEEEEDDDNDEQEEEFEEQEIEEQVEDENGHTVTQKKTIHVRKNTSKPKKAKRDPRRRLPFAKTMEQIDERKSAVSQLDRELEHLRTLLPRQQKDLQRRQTELVPLRQKRQSSWQAAREAQRRKEASLGGVEDDLEERGRWFRASEALVRGLVSQEGSRA